MEIRLLGPVGLWDEGVEVELARSHRRAVLAVLAMTPRRPVAFDVLIDRVWGEEPPREVRHSLYSHVSAIRRRLAQLGPASGGSQLRRLKGAYLLDVDPDRVDLHRARRLAAEARQLAGDAADQDRRALRLWQEASALWRADPLGGVGGEWAARVRAGLHEEWLALVVERYRLELRLGHHAAVVGPLAALLADHPLAEPLAGLQMIALYRSGRQEAALEVYTRLRRRLVAELGDEPGVELRELHERILRRDPALDLAPAPAPVALAGTVPAQLPADIGGFCGRADALATLDTLRSRPAESPRAVVIVAIGGPPGVGKSALAVHWAHRVRDQFPDGQLFLHLRGHSSQPPLPVVEALGRLLAALGLPPGTIPSDVDRAAAAYRSLTADKRLLVVLDDAAGVEQVRPLLPGGAGCFVVVTTRVRMDGLLAREGAHWLGLAALTPPEARALLDRLLGASRVAREPAAAADLARACGHLPLALRIAAANLAARPGHRIRDYATRLAGPDRVSALEVVGDPESSVRRAFDLSVDRLPTPARQLFCRLGTVPGPDLSAAAVAALAGTDAAEAQRLLDLLVAAYLVEEPAPGRYALHDLLRRYAADRAEREEEEPARRAAADRLHSYYLATTEAAAHLLYPEKAWLPVPAAYARHRLSLPDQRAALAWLEAELPALVGVVRHAAAHGPHQVAWLLGALLRGFFLLRGGGAEWLAVAEAGLAAAEASGDAAAQAASHLSLGDAHLRAGDYRKAAVHYRRALRAAECSGTVDQRPAILNNLGMVHSLLGDLRRAANFYRRAIDLNRRVGHRFGEAVQLGNLGCVLQAEGRLRQAVEFHTRALAMHRQLGNLTLQGCQLHELGVTYAALGCYPRALRHLRDALAVFRQLGSRVHEVEVRLTLTAVRRDLGKPDDEPCHEALAFARELADRHLEATCLHILGTVHRRLGHHRRALDHLGEALELATELRTAPLQADALADLARTHLDQGEHQPARTYLRRALDLAEASGLRLTRARVLTHTAALALGEADPTRATACAEAALSICRETGHRPGEAYGEAVLAQARRQAGDLPGAERHERRAQMIVTDLGVPEPVG